MRTDHNPFRAGLRYIVVFSCSVVSDSLWPHRLLPARLLCPRDFLGKNTGVGCHFLLQGLFPWDVYVYIFQEEVKFVWNHQAIHSPPAFWPRWAHESHLLPGDQAPPLSCQVVDVYYLAWASLSADLFHPKRYCLSALVWAPRIVLCLQPCVWLWNVFVPALDANTLPLRGAGLPFASLVIFLKYLLIYLFALGLSCSMRDLQSSLKHGGSLVVACGI